MPRDCHGDRPTSRVTPREIAVLIVCKLAAVALIYALFFGPAHRPAIDAGRVETNLFAGSPHQGPKEPPR